MSDTNTDTTTPKLPKETKEDVAVRLIATVVPKELQQRMEALRGAAVDLAQAFGPAVLDLQRECSEVEAAVDAAFGSTPSDYEIRYLGTGLDHARGVLAFLSELTEGSYDIGRDQLAGVVAEYPGEQDAS